MSELETRLRDELTAAARDVRTSPDSWQRNQQLLATDRSGRRLRATWLLSAAAVVAVVVTGIAVLSGTGDTRPTPPADSDGFEDLHVLGGRAVEVARLGSGPDQVSVEMAIALGVVKGGEPDMCTRFVTGPNSTRSCGGQSADQENTLVAFDYLNVSQSSTNSAQGAVDPRVAVVRAWLSDGTEVQPRLVHLGVLRLRGFAVPTRKGEPYAVRLAAYASDGKALEYVNLATRFGPEWGADTRIQGCAPAAGCRIEDFDPGLFASFERHPDNIVVSVWAGTRTIQFKDGADVVAVFVVDSPLLVTRNEFGRGYFGGAIPEDLTVVVTDGLNSAVNP